MRVASNCAVEMLNPTSYINIQGDKGLRMPFAYILLLVLLYRFYSFDEANIHSFPILCHLDNKMHYVNNLVRIRIRS